ncbi:MAG: sigma-70 family RNA polymerase sigma factor [bacterium]|nr:sigma-70 family RNA polymerase sigma factor [bacterium]
MKKNEDILLSVRQCLNGRTESYAGIVRFFQKKIYNLCYHYLGTPQDAEDAAADIFIKAYNALASFNPEYNFSTWLFKIASNHSIGILRKQKRERDYLQSHSQGQNKQPDEKRIALVESKTPDAVFFKEAQDSSLKETLTDLPEKYRTVLMLKYHEGFSYRKISEIMDIPVNTVGSLVLRGKKVLRERVESKEVLK